MIHEKPSICKSMSGLSPLLRSQKHKKIRPARKIENFCCILMVEARIEQKMTQCLKDFRRML